MIRWVVDHATTIFLAVGAVFLFGLLSYITLPRESSPDISIPVVMVTTPYIGVAPEDIEGLVTIPIEGELASLRNVKLMSSTSGEGISFIAIEFEPETDVADAVQRVRDRVNRARPRLPADVEESTIREISFNDIPVLYATLVGPLDEEKLVELAEDMKDEVLRKPGVLDARVTGGRTREIRVQVIPERLAHYGLQMSDVTSAIANENVNVPGGNVVSGQGTFLLRVPGEFTDPAQLQEVAIKRVGDRPVLVRDIARVVDGFRDRETYSRMNGQPSVTLSVTKRGGANILEVATLTKELVAEHAETWPPGVEYRILGDQSRYVETFVSDLQNNIITALILVVTVIVFFMGFRNSLFVAFAIPMSMLASMMVLDFIGFTLNMVVLFSLILALGMLVDNAIVVVENIYRHLEEGYGHADAAVLGTGEVGMAVAASTTTTVAAFFPLVFWTGIMGEWMGYLPKTLIIVLVSSLIVAVLVLPTFTARLMRVGKIAEKTEDGDVQRGRIAGAYRALLEWSIRWRYLSAAGMVAILFGTFAVYGGLNHGTEFFPETQPDRAIVSVRAPEGTDLEQTDRIVRQVERILAAEPNIDVWVAETGVAGASDEIVGSQAAPNEARLTVDFHPDAGSAKPDEKVRIEDTMLTVKRVRQKVQEIVGAEIKIDKQNMGPPVGPPVAVEVRGESFHEVGGVARELRRALVAAVPGVTDVRDDYRVGRPEMRLRVDRAAAKRVGVSTNKIGGTVRTAVAGTKASALRDGQDEYDIVVELAPEYREDLQSILSLRLPGREDTSVDTFAVPLSAVATYELAGGSGAIQHKDQDLVVTISADVLTGFNANAVRADVESFLDSYEFPAGMSAALGGADDEQQKSMEFLMRAFLVALALILMVLVTQFDSVGVPAIILGTVILSLIGVLWGLLITGTPFGIIMTGIGVISLAGVVVNNAIVLLDYVQQLEARGMTVNDALVRAGLTRFRPVMLTAITTNLGLLPMAVGASVDFSRLRIVLGSTSAQMWGPMAIAVIFGLTFATILTLVMVPTFYSISNDFAQAFAAVRRRLGFGGRTVVAAPAKVLLGAVLLGAGASEAGAVTLEEAYRAADTNNATLLLQREQTIQAETLRGKAWSVVQPRVSMSATYVINQEELAFNFLDNVPAEFESFFDADSVEPTIFQEQRFWMADLVVNQRLFSGRALPLLRGAYATATAQRLRESSQRQRVHAMVAQAFYGLATAREGMKVADTALQTATDQLELAQRQFDAGLTDSRAVLQAKLGVASAKRDVEAAREGLVAAQEAFAQATGLPRDSELDVPPTPAVPPSLDDALRLARETRPDLQASHHDLRAAKAQATANKLDWVPKIDGQFAYEFSENRGFGGGPPWQWRVSLVASWNLWDGGMKLAEAREYASQQRAAEITQWQLRDGVEEEVRVLWEGHRRAGVALDSVQSELELAAENLELTQRAFSAGSATWLEVDMAELQFRSTELAVIRERMNRDLVAIQLLVATGTL